MDFPITDLMDDQACYTQLVDWLHPDGLACPRCHRDDRLLVHRRGRDPEDPPRRRANATPGHGTWENDRPSVCGLVGRESGEIRLSVTERSDGETLDTVVRCASWPMVTVNTDEWCGYNGLPEMGRARATVCHVAGEWARDDDGDGTREVHVNTLEGLWTGLRNFLRPFRVVNKCT
jgi:hypothetical protein